LIREAIWGFALAFSSLIGSDKPPTLLPYQCCDVALSLSSTKLMPIQ
jgi:hypothetical protein